MGSFDQGEPTAIQRQHAPVDAVDLVAGLRVEVFKAGACRYIRRGPRQLAFLEGLEHVPRETYLSALLSCQPLLDQPLPPRPQRGLDFRTKAGRREFIRLLSNEPAIEPGCPQRLRQILQPLP